MKHCTEQGITKSWINSNPFLSNNKLNLLLDDKILDRSKLEQIADNI